VGNLWIINHIRLHTILCMNYLLLRIDRVSILNFEIMNTIVNKYMLPVNFVIMLIYHFNKIYKMLCY
jgi:hypothetical protein